MTENAYAQVKVSALRDALKKHSPLSEDEIEGLKGKGNLIKAVESYNINIFGSNEPEEVFEDDLDDAVVDENLNHIAKANIEYPSKKLRGETTHDIYGENSLDKTLAECQDIPEYGTEGWSDYVMEQFTEDELFEGRPTVSGLRRVTEELLGEIVESRPKIFSLFNDCYVCTYEVVVAMSRELLEEGDGYFDINTVQIPHRRFGAIGEASFNNTAGVFQNYQASIAETRAEGRALKKALCIKCTTAEELMIDNNTSVGSKVDMEAEWDGNEKMSTTQKTFIKTKCSALGIDVDKFLNKKFYLGEADSPQFSSIDDDGITRELASAMITEINQYQSSTSQSKSIPEQIKVK